MRRVKLGQICEVVSGGTPKTNVEEYWNGEFNWITPAEINDNDYIISDTKRKITQLAIEKKKLPLLPKGTVLLSSRAPIGKVAITGKEMYCNQGFKNLICSDEICNEYLYWYLKSKKEYLNSLGRGATFKEISKKIVENIEIKLPEIEQQRKIVNKLKEVDKIIQQRKCQSRLLDGMVQSRFIEVFGNPESNSKGWKECSLSEKLNVLGGYAFKSDQFDENIGIPVLRIGNINAGYFKPVNMVYWKEDSKLAKYTLYPGDLVMSLTGTVGKDDYGNVCILGNDYEMYYLNQRNAKLEIKKDINKYYLSQLLRFKQIKKKLTGISRGVRQANISNKDILNLVIPIPPMELQEQFAAFVQQVNKSKFVIHKFLYCTTHNTQSIIKPRPNTKESGKTRGGKPYADEF